MERWDEAAEERREVISRGEDVWQQWSALAEMEARAGNVDGAREAYASALERADTEEAREQIEAARAALEIGAPGGS